MTRISCAERDRTLRPAGLAVASGILALLTAACSPVQQLQNVAAAGGALASSVTGTGEPLALTPQELRLLQTRDFETTKAAAFASTMTVLLDSGYRVLSADLESGLITASAPAVGRLRLDTAGVARASQRPVASAYLEERGNGAVRVRIAFSVDVSATGQLASTGERPVLDAGIYEAFFARLEDEIRLRPRPAVVAPPPQEPVAAQPVTEPDVRPEESPDVPAPAEVSEGADEVTSQDDGEPEATSAGEPLEPE